MGGAAVVAAAGVERGSDHGSTGLVPMEAAEAVAAEAAGLLVEIGLVDGAAGDAALENDAGAVAVEPAVERVVDAARVSDAEVAVDCVVAAPPLPGPAAGFAEPETEEVADKADDDVAPENDAEVVAAAPAVDTADAVA